ncbi:MAG: hypothetical protein A2293_04505 [Elusimicrobia bacterium RIFOXYB2_FULL_49_7]|nr:MAG: hypothetical protein A2293_04505 [Elusimicrobia bacterium RIFOXYB2_FULL_49_7]
MGIRFALLFCFFLFFNLSFGADSIAAASTPGTPASEKEFDMGKLRAELLNEAAGLKEKKEEKRYRSSGSKEAIMLTLKAMFYISIISVLLYYAIRFLKKGMFGRGLSRRLGGRSVQILESVTLGQNRSLTLIRIAGRVLLLGATDKEIRSLTTFEDAESVAAINRQYEDPVPVVAAGFSNTVNAFLGRLKGDSAVRPLSSMQETKE